MNCYECSKVVHDRAAVAICKGCGAGLCLDHLHVAAAARGPGGTSVACLHDTWAVTWAAQPSAKRVPDAVPVPQM